MEKMEKSKGRSIVLLVFAIIILCVGFVIINCGSGAKMKIADPFKNHTAIDFTDCTDAGSSVSGCTAVITSDSFDLEKYKIAGKELTIEAWVKAKATSAATIFSRMNAGGGVKLFTGTTTTPNSVIPKFMIAHPKSSTATTTAEYIATSTSPITVGTWYHIAGVIVKANHSGVHSACAAPDAGAEASTTAPHIDIYVDGVFKGCAKPYGGSGDTTLAADAYASDPVGDKTVAFAFNGVVDEARLWTTARTMAQIVACKNTELGNNSSECGRDNDYLITYVRFNEGTGHTVTDLAGLGSGAKEYNAGNGVFPEWNTGWTTEVPTLTSAE